MKWLDTYQSESTKELYECAVRLFLRCVGKTESEYLSAPQDYERDVTEFFAEIKDRAPLTVKAYLCAVKAFFEYNGIKIDATIFKRLIQHRRGGAQTMDRAPTREELKRIVENVRLDYKALFLLLSSSGMRISEALSLAWGDVDLEERTAIIRKTKSGNPRLALFSVEAKEYLSQLPAGEHIFTMTANSAQHAFIMAQKAIGIYEQDANTGRSILHLHSLRKYFFSHMSGINREMTEALMGHEGYLTGAYRRFSADDLKKWYRENERALWIFAQTEQNMKDKERISQLESRIAGLESALIELSKELKKRRA